MSNEIASSGVGASRWSAALVVLTLGFGLGPASLHGLRLQDPACCAPDVEAPTPGPARLTLEDAVARALRQNRQIEAAGYALEEANERVAEAWGNVYPSLDLTADYTRNVSPAVSFVPASFFDPMAPTDELVPLQFGADNVWTTSIRLEQPIFNATAFIGVGAAGRFQTLQEEVRRSQVQAVVTEVRSAYYDLLLAQEQARLTENSVRRVRESLAETTALNRAGLAAEYDVLRLQVELANLEPNLLRARNAIQQARRQLGVALDLDAEDAETLEVAGSLATMDLDDPSLNSPENRDILTFAGVRRATTGTDAPEADELVERAMGRRSDLRQLELTASLRKTEVRLEQIEYLPEISFFGAYSINASQNGSPDFFGEPRAYSRLVGVQLSLPIFQGLQRDARIDQRRAALRAVETEAARARKAAASEIRTLVDQVGEARARAEGQGLAVGQARRGYEIARAQFREGLSGQLELTDSEVALRQSEFNYAQAVYDYLVARARLDEATGVVPLVDPEGTAEETGG